LVTKQYKTKGLILFIFFSSFFSLANISINNSKFLDVNSIYYQNEELFSPEIADYALPLWTIEQNATTIYRLFESVNFTIDTFEIDDVDHSKMQISFSNGSTRYYNMNSVGNDKYSYEYKPEYNAPLGFQNVSFLIYNETNTLLNLHTTYTNFTIVTNYLVNLNSSEYYIEDFLNAEMIVSNFSTYDFTWNVTLVDSLDVLVQNDLLDLGKKIVQFTFPIKNETFINKDQFYYIQLNMTDKNSGREETAYFPFYVRNNDPIISSIIEFSSDEIFRTEECTISFNSTDIETLSKNLVPTMYIYDAEGALVLQNLIEFDSENLFSDTFIIPAHSPIGKYKIEVRVRDQHGATFSKETFLTVKNNAPEIHSYTINGLSMNQAISIYYGRNMVFNFNISDKEKVSYVKVALINKNNEWFNITREYKGQNTEITIRTYDLIAGVWFVYLYVVDSDGAVTSLIDDYDKAPQGITIIPDVLSNFLPWILFFAGLSIGILSGIGIIYGYFKTKFRESQKTIHKKKETTTKKAFPKKKEKSKSNKEELEEKEIEEFELYKDEEKEGIPKRKIKRKL